MTSNIPFLAPCEGFVTFLRSVSVKKNKNLMMGFATIVQL
jgi:hypothetical protein